MEVLKYPDPVLRRGGKPIATFDADLRATAEAMLQTMYSYKGVGLAAPQVGLELSLLVLNPSGEPGDRREEMALCNPKIQTRKHLEFGEEGCLSFPGIYAEIERHRDIVVCYQDLDGKELEVPVDGFLARIVQHELDHLQGVLFIDRMSPADRIRVRNKLGDLEQRFRAGA